MRGGGSLSQLCDRVCTDQPASRPGQSWVDSSVAFENPADWKRNRDNHYYSGIWRIAFLSLRQKNLAEPESYNRWAGWR